MTCIWSYHTSDFRWIDLEGSEVRCTGAAMKGDLCRRDSTGIHSPNASEHLWCFIQDMEMYKDQQNTSPAYWKLIFFHK